MTRAYWLSTLSRVFCGCVFLIHGLPKLQNLDGTRMFFDNVGIPAWVAMPIAFLEVFGGVLLIAGLLTRIVAGLFILEMMGAALFVHLERGWDVFEGGVEFNIALILLLLGPMLVVGPLSVDHVIGFRKRRSAAPTP